MQQRWIHYRSIKSVCKTCGKPAHLGLSLKSDDYYWLHDNRNQIECRACHKAEENEYLDELNKRARKDHKVQKMINQLKEAGFLGEEL